VDIEIRKPKALTKQLGRTVLLFRAFADFGESDFDLEHVGEYPVRGFNDPPSCLRIAAEGDLSSDTGPRQVARTRQNGHRQRMSVSVADFRAHAYIAFIKVER
jgi:hypothetical protein